MNKSIRPLSTLPARLLRLAGYLARAILGPARNRAALLVRRLAFWTRIRIRGQRCTSFRCNLCGRYCRVPEAELRREAVTCCGCGSSVRMRAVVEALMAEVVGAPGSVLIHHPGNHSLVGYGLSDSVCYARPMARKFRYTNTYYHREPRLDITCVDSRRYVPADFIIASEVLEHVAPPVSTALRNLFGMLQPGGILVVTVPIVSDRDACEHYPRLGRYRVERRDGRTQLVNQTDDGEVQVFVDPVFHEGAGEALEMRRFSLPWLGRELEQAGFTGIRVLGEDKPEWGTVWQGDRSVPVVARRPT